MKKISMSARSRSLFKKFMDEYRAGRVFVKRGDPRVRKDGKLLLLIDALAKSAAKDVAKSLGTKGSHVVRSKVLSNVAILAHYTDGCSRYWFTIDSETHKIIEYKGCEYVCGDD